MAGQGRITPGASTPGEIAQSSEETSEPLEWHRELDVAIDDIDSRLKHARRRATDAKPALPQTEITSETIDEIAWRVAELLKQNGSTLPEGPAVGAAISETVATAAPARKATTAKPVAPPLPPLPEPKRLPHGIAMSIRIRKPFFRLPWPFRRRRRQAMIMFSDYRIT